MPPAREVTEEDCQYTDIHGTAVHSPTINNILANLAPRHYALAALALLAAMLASATATYFLLTTNHPILQQIKQLAPVTPSFTNVHKPAAQPPATAAAAAASSHYDYTAAATLAAQQNTDDASLPPILPTPSLPLTATPNPNSDTPNCWSSALHAQYTAGTLYAQHFNQRRLWGSPRYTLSDVLVVVTTTGRYHASRAEAVMCTWASELPPGHVLLASDDDDATRTLPLLNVLSDAPAERTRSRVADHNAVVVGGWMAAVERGRELGVSWYVRVDDDTYLAPNNLVRLINQYNHTDRRLIGQVCDLAGNGAADGKPTGIPRLCGGAGELLSAALLDTAAAFLDQCDPHNGDTADVFLPRCIADRVDGVQLEDRLEMGSQAPDFYYRQAQGVKDREKGFGKAVSFHYVRPWQMYFTLHKLYEAFQS